jgi:hypothetical protein
MLLLLQQMTVDMQNKRLFTLYAVRVLNLCLYVVPYVNVVATSAADMLMCRTYVLMCHVYLTPDAVAT